ncbi:MAG: hypoxanthine-guanine phosphoribosyltransferase [Methylococcaceae bacterium]|nr:hypoxanthine-guanine phosphoribosyltransferase [Methylococcaceae bacterium]
MIDEIKQVEATADLLYSEAEVETAIEKMAENINLLLADRNPIILCVMNGGIVVAGKLMTRLNFPLTIDGINASRYRNKTSGGEIKWILKPASSLKDRTILIVDDILDEGITLAALYDYCREQGADSIYSAVLIDKKLNRKKPVIADFIGLETEDRYLFGYGMDYKGYLRNAAGIYACKEEDNS